MVVENGSFGISFEARLYICLHHLTFTINKYKSHKINVSNINGEKAH